MSTITRTSIPKTTECLVGFCAEWLVNSCSFCHHQFRSPLPYNFPSRTVPLKTSRRFLLSSHCLTDIFKRCCVTDLGYVRLWLFAVYFKERLFRLLVRSVFHVQRSRCGNLVRNLDRYRINTKHYALWRIWFSRRNHWHLIAITNESNHDTIIPMISFVIVDTLRRHSCNV